MKTKRVALLTKYMTWGGGLEFLRYLLNGMLSLNSHNSLDIYMILDEDFKNSDLYNIFVDLFNEDICLRKNVIFYNGSVQNLEFNLQKFNIDIIMPVNSDLGADFAIPWVGYIPDFQHKYLYKNFSPEECFVREVAFSARLRDSKIVVVNSQAVKQDIIRFYPWIDHKSIFALPFSPHTSEEYLQEKPWLINSIDNLPKNYFLISNQFWIHKNHKMAFKAFALFASDKEISLICTGLMKDYRNIDYLNELKVLIDELGLKERILLFGHIPKRQQIELMKNSLALIQPTSFEGGPGGGSVYNAVSLGVPVILSDIEINTEVLGKNLYFFKCGDETSLCAQMNKFFYDKKQTIKKSELILWGNNNLQLLGESIFDLINYTLAIYNK